MTEIFKIISSSTFSIVVALLVVGFLAYMFIKLFKREIKAYLKKKFELYDRFEVVAYARHYADRVKGYNNNLAKADQELNNYLNKK